jgi:hypothetical protein
MLGVMFFQLQKYVQTRLDPSLWQRLFKEVGLSSKFYSPMLDYPDEEAVALIQAACQITDQSLDVFLENFGEALAPDFLALYKDLIRPEWKTLDVVMNAEETIHAAVRKHNPHAKPPVLQCLRVGENEIQLIYSSSRKLCSLAKGLLKGLARHYGQEILLNEPACMHRGDPFCALEVSLRMSQISAGNTTFWQQKAQETMPSQSVCALPQAAPAAPQPELGRIAHYRLLRKLGSGGMGIVYLAEDSQLGRQVALKVILPEMAADLEHRERFLREAKAAAGVQNDHIITIYQVGQHEGSLYIAMQLLQGMSLEEWIERHNPVPLPQIVRIGREIANALSAFHECRLVHRDLKPANIWMEAPTDRVKLLDFGMVRDTEIQVRLTHTGAILGTPQYMAPEQANGETVDFRCDLFNLGIILYRLCSGEMPFKGDSIMSLLTALAVSVPKPPHELRPDLPTPLADLIMQLLAKKPEDRPSSARVVEEVLMGLADNVLVGTPA